jgi:hypothetical protein
VRAAVLTGLSLITGGVIAAADTVLVALGKLQKQITDLGSSKQDTLVSGTTIKTINGASVLGSGDLAVSSTIATRTVSSSGGVLNLSSFTETVFLVTLTENITSIQLPAGVAGQSKEARIVFTQAAGNYAIPTTTAAWGSIAVEGGGSIPQMGTGAGTGGVYVLANDNNGTWRMYVDQGPLSSFRNKLIDGNFQVNQRGVSGTVVLTAGQFGHDRWKAGASGCTYTFSTAGGITTITITAGSLQQVIEGNNLQTGTHTLSWSGTAQGKIGAGSYSASGVTASVTGGSNLTIEFNTGTLSLVQFEPGSVATPFEHRLYSQELSLCQRYLPAFIAGDANSFFGTGYSFSTTAALIGFPFKVTPRVSPTGITVSSASHFNVGNGVGTQAAASAVALTFSGLDGACITFTVSGHTASQGAYARANSASARILFEGCEL